MTIQRPSQEKIRTLTKDLVAIPLPPTQRTTLQLLKTSLALLPRELLLIKTKQEDNMIPVPGLSFAYNPAPKTDANVRLKREKEGRCPVCGAKTHEVKKVGFKKVKEPLTIPYEVHRGRCLRCEYRRYAQLAAAVSTLILIVFMLSRGKNSSEPMKFCLWKFCFTPFHHG